MWKGVKMSHQKCGPIVSQKDVAQIHREPICHPKGGPIEWTNSVTNSHKMLHESYHKYTGSQYVTPN